MNQTQQSELNSWRTGTVSKIQENGGFRRGQFTFYASFFDAINSLPKSRQLEVYQAVVGYALFGQEPELTGSAKSVFSAIRPVLESSRGKAASRLQRSQQEQEKE